MKRKFVTNLVLLVALNLLIKPFWIFGIDRVAQNTVGESEYGFYYALFNFSFLFSIVLDLGINNFNNKNISQNSQLLSKHFPNLVALKVLLLGFYLVASLATAFFISYSAEQLQLLFVLLINQFLLSFLLYQRSNIAALQQFKADSVISVLDRVLMILFCGGLILYHRQGTYQLSIKHFVYAQVLAYSLTNIMAFLYLRTKLSFSIPRLRQAFSRAILRQSLPFALLFLLMTFYSRVDSVMLERMLLNGTEQVGFYAQGYRIFEAASNFAYLFSTLLLPIFSKMLKQKDDIRSMAKLAAYMLIVPASIVATSCFMYREEIISLLYHNNASNSGNVFGILILGFIPVSVTYIYGTLLTAHGSLRNLNIMAGSAVVLNVTLNALLIPRYQALGAAMATLGTQAITALVQFFMAMQLFKFKFRIRALLALLLFAAGMLTIAHWISHMPIHWGIGMAVIVIESLAIAFLTKLLNLKQLVDIVRDNDGKEA